MKHSRKLEAFAEKEIVALADNLVLADGDRYFLFGRYDLEKLDHGVLVADRNNYIGTFGSTKSAVAWCVADKYKQLNMASRIQQLDQEHTRHVTDIAVKRLLMLQSKSYDFKDTLSVKILHQQRQCRAIEIELSKCIKMAKYWQYRGFNNETQRTSSTQTR
jgi:uncharacterized protein (DUF39 family)